MSMNDLTRATSLSAADLLALWPAAAQDTQVATLATLLAWLQSNWTPASTLTVTPQYAAPSATGFSVTVGQVAAAPSTWLVLTPAAGYAAGTIVFPASPVDTQRLSVSCTQAVTTLTINGNGKTVNGAPTTLAANGYFEMRYSATLSAWFRAE